MRVDRMFRYDESIRSGWNAFDTLHSEHLQRNYSTQQMSDLLELLTVDMKRLIVQAELDHASHMPLCVGEVEYLMSDLPNTNISFFSAGSELVSSSIVHQLCPNEVISFYNMRLPNKELRYEFGAHERREVFMAALRKNLTTSSLRLTGTDQEIFWTSFDVLDEQYPCDDLLLDLRSTYTILCNRVGSLLPQNEANRIVKDKVISIMDETLESLPGGSACIVYLTSNISTLNEEDPSAHAVERATLRTKDSDPMIAAEGVKELRDAVVRAIHALP